MAVGGSAAGVVGTFAGQAGAEYREAGTAAVAGVSTVFRQGGAGMGFVTLLSGYLGFIATPSVLAMFIESTFTLVVVSLVGVLAGGLLGMTLGVKVAAALRDRGKSQWYALLPLLALCAWLTLRIPGALSAWWAQ
jgi:p-aminobenzoyl-glutamate transporter AbgT